MNLKEKMIKSFEPDVLVKVESLGGKVPQSILREVQQPLGEKYDTMMDLEGGVIYLKVGKRKSSAQILKDKLERGDKEIEGYSEMKDQEKKGGG